MYLDVLEGWHGRRQAQLRRGNGGCGTQTSRQIGTVNCQSLPHFLTNEIFDCGDKSNLHFSKRFVEWWASVFGALKRRHFGDGVTNVFGQRLKLFAHVVLQLGLVLLAAFVECSRNGTGKNKNLDFILHKYCQRPKSELVQFSDVQLLAQFLWYLDSV